MTRRPIMDELALANKLRAVEIHSHLLRGARHRLDPKDDSQQLAVLEEAGLGLVRRGRRAVPRSIISVPHHCALDHERWPLSG